MKIDTNELREVATAGAGRVDLYAGIHKAVRAILADTVLAVGRMDADDDLELAQVTQRVVELLDFCRHHLEKENTFVHPAIEARAPGATARVGHEHEDHERHLAELAHAVERLRALPIGGRDAAATQLYRDLALFAAGNYEHMNVEETAHNTVLWARCTDAELLQLHGSILASIPPAEMMFTLRWMVPFMSPKERAQLLTGMRANAPAPAFQAALDTVRPHLSDVEWSKLARALEIAPVPGLVG